MRSVPSNVIHAVSRDHLQFLKYSTQTFKNGKQELDGLLQFCHERTLNSSLQLSEWKC